jgi:hypothetical protein
MNGGRTGYFRIQSENSLPKRHCSSSLTLLTVLITLIESYLVRIAIQGIQAETLTRIGTPDRNPPQLDPPH